MLRSLMAPLVLFFLVALVVPAAEAQYVEIVKLGAPDLTLLDQFGEGVAISGDRLAVASRHWKVDTGSVYIYERNQGGSNTWGPVAKILDPTPQVGELFAFSVDLEGSTLVVGKNPNPTDSIYIFELTSRGTWELTREINDRTYGPNRISGDTMVAPGDVDRVYVFERDAGGPGSWGHVAALVPSVGPADKFGGSVAIDGDIVVAGDYGDIELGLDAGAAYVWERDGGGVWQEQEVAKLFASDGAEGDEFGRSVAVEGDLIAVGAKFVDAPLGNTGAVYLFRRDEFGGWNEIAKLVADNAEAGDVAGGSSVAISQGRVIVGASGHDSGGIRSSGAVFVFEEDEFGAWQQVATLHARPGDAEELDFFGDAVAASGNTIATGAFADDELGFDTGAAYVFEPIASPIVGLVGSCPGEVSFSVTGATPGGVVAVGAAGSEGLTPLPAQVCPGVEMGLEEPRLLRHFLVDANGEAQFTRQVGAGFCGWYLQALDVVTCGVGATSPLP